MSLGYLYHGINYIYYVPTQQPEKRRAMQPLPLPIYVHDYALSLRSHSTTAGAIGRVKRLV